MSLSRKLLFFPMLTIGIFILFMAINSRDNLPTKPATDRSRLVETFELESSLVAPKVIGFGTVKPKLEWKAISEVTGKVLYRHSRLDKGQIIEAGTEIIRIDPLDYELRLAQAQTDLSSSQTQLAKLIQENANLQGTLKIEKSRLTLSENERNRKQNLFSKGLASQSEIDQLDQSLLSQKKLVQDIENQIALFPEEKKVSEAMVKINQSKVNEAENTLKRTSIVLPKTMRIASVDIEKDQVVNMQQVMIVAHSIDEMEVEAQLSIHDLQVLSNSVIGSSSISSSVIPALDKMSATIHLSSGRLSASWPAKVARLSESVDASQATAGVILEIDQSIASNTENQPLLVNGMFIRADIEGQNRAGFQIPERALHGDKVYVMSQDNTLDIREVAVQYRRDGLVIIAGDVMEGDKLILNDLLPAVEGMLLRDIDNRAGMEEAL
jgi:hypothetical protein